MAAAVAAAAAAVGAVGAAAGAAGAAEMDDSSDSSDTEDDEAGNAADHRGPTAAGYVDYAQARDQQPGYAAAAAETASGARVVNGLGETVYVLDIANRGMKTTEDVGSMLLKFISSKSVLEALKGGYVQIILGDHYAYRILRAILERDCAGLHSLMAAAEPDVLASVHATLAEVYAAPVLEGPELLYRVTRQVLSWQGTAL